MRIIKEKKLMLKVENDFFNFVNIYIKEYIIFFYKFLFLFF